MKSFTGSMQLLLQTYFSNYHVDILSFFENIVHKPGTFCSVYNVSTGLVRSTIIYSYTPHPTRCLSLCGKNNTLVSILLKKYVSILQRRHSETILHTLQYNITRYNPSSPDGSDQPLTTSQIRRKLYIRHQIQVTFYQTKFLKMLFLL